MQRVPVSVVSDRLSGAQVRQDCVPSDRPRDAAVRGRVSRVRCYQGFEAQAAKRRVAPDRIGSHFRLRIA